MGSTRLTFPQSSVFRLLFNGKIQYVDFHYFIDIEHVPLSLRLNIISQGKPRLLCFFSVTNGNGGDFTLFPIQNRGRFLRTV